MDYRRLDYFGLQGRLDYKDIWTTADWTTKTNRLKVFRPLGGGYISLSVAFQPNPAKRWSTTALTLWTISIWTVLVRIS